MKCPRNPFHSKSQYRNQSLENIEACYQTHRHGSSKLLSFFLKQRFTNSCDDILRAQNSAARFMDTNIHLLYQFMEFMDMCRNVVMNVELFDNINKWRFFTPNSRYVTHVFSRCTYSSNSILKCGRAQPEKTNAAIEDSQSLKTIYQMFRRHSPITPHWSYKSFCPNCRYCDWNYLLSAMSLSHWPIYWPKASQTHFPYIMPCHGAAFTAGMLIMIELIKAHKYLHVWSSFRGSYVPINT